MFPKKELDAYQSIKAPDTLYRKIQEASEGQKRTSRLPAIRLIGTMAACLVLIVAVIGFFPRKGSPEIILNGQRLESSAFFYDISPASEIRSSPVFSVPLEIDLQGEATLTVSYGQMIAEDHEASSVLTADGPISLWWEFPRGEELPLCEMEIQTEESITLITLTYDHAEKTITATKTQK